MANLLFLVDIGTTTVTGALSDAKGNKILSSSFVLNQQLKFGDDIVSRIDFALKSTQNSEILQKKVTLSINKLLKELLLKTKKSKKDIRSCFCVCNTAMHHLFLGIDPTSLITPPYRASQKAEMIVYSDRLGINLNKSIPITLLPNIGGFVGSDALSVILASGIHLSKDIKLVVDIGTNGEIVLGNKEKILVASTAAGPAFEGRYISSGMPAIEGAIEAVKISSKKITLKVIGNKPPSGIAGSGLIDASYEILRTNNMNGSGKLKENEFILYKRAGNKISITQADIRKLQLAKAAIFAGIKILMRRYNIESKDIKEVIITGSFGNTVNAKSLIGVGLIPKVDKKRVKFLPEGAIEGLRLYTKDRKLHEEILGVLSKIQHIPLLGKGFGDEFVSSLSIG